MDLPIHWGPAGNHRWSVKRPGWGTSSPVVYGDRVIITSEIADNDTNSLLTLCFDPADGQELWRHDFGFGVNQQTHEKSNLAVNTPAFTYDVLYVAFGNSDIARYSHDGTLTRVKRYIPEFGERFHRVVLHIPESRFVVKFSQICGEQSSKPGIMQRDAIL